MELLKKWIYNIAFCCCLVLREKRNYLIMYIVLTLEWFCFKCKQRIVKIDLKRTLLFLLFRSYYSKVDIYLFGYRF